MQAVTCNMKEQLSSSRASHQRQSSTGLLPWRCGRRGMSFRELVETHTERLAAVGYCSAQLLYHVAQYFSSARLETEWELD